MGIIGESVPVNLLLTFLICVNICCNSKLHKIVHTIMMQRHNANSSSRYPEYWEGSIRILRERDNPEGIPCGSFFDWLRHWEGLQNLSLTFYGEPFLVPEMFQFLADFFCETLHLFLDKMEIDYPTFWEDIAYNQASLISPRIFREFMIPRYRQVVDLLHSHGVDMIIVDCDGNIQELLPLWLEVGVNTIEKYKRGDGN